MNAIIRPSVSKWLTFDDIDFPTNARPTNATDVVALVHSIRTIGLQVPLTVIERDGRYVLIAGRHRLEALRVIGGGEDVRIPVRVVNFDDIEARLWTISENLHRTELSALQRAQQIAEFARLAQERLAAKSGAPFEQQPARPEPVEQPPAMTEPVEQRVEAVGEMPGSDYEASLAQLEAEPQFEPLAFPSDQYCQTADDDSEQEGVSRQLGAKPQGEIQGGQVAQSGGRYEQRGNSFAARELGITREEVRRSIKIDGITPEAKEAAHEAGLADNQSALLKVASYAGEDQVEAVAELAKAKAAQGSKPRPQALRNLEMTPSQLVTWIRGTRPTNLRQIIDLLRACADILDAKPQAEQPASEEWSRLRPTIH
jgi:ParB-like nuclease domain